MVGFGGGITAKELKRVSSKAALLEKLNASEKENELLKKCMDELENKYQHMNELEKKYQCMDELESKYQQHASVHHHHSVD